MKKWFRFFFCSFFSHKSSKDGAKRNYANFFLGFVIALVFLWVGFVGGDMLPFGTHYNNSTDFREAVHSVLASPDKRIDLEIQDGTLKAKNQSGEYIDGLLVNTLEKETDKQNYSVNGYEVVVDLRPADTLAEVEVYFISNDGNNLKISYDEYLTLSEVARLNFDFKMRYTGNELELSDESVDRYRSYLAGLEGEGKTDAEALSKELAENKITTKEYNRAIYELYFASYYPEITEYESSSKVPLLRNYYYHQYISQGVENYLFIFDDCMTASFETKGGIVVSFYGFYTNMENGAVVMDGATEAQANAAADRFVKKSFKAIGALNLYAYGMNVLSLAPFIALMAMVVTLLTYSIIKLKGVESISTVGAMFKIVGSYVWFSGVISAVLSVIIAFFVPRNLISALPLVIFFVALAVRSVIFVMNESRLYIEKLEQQLGQMEA